MTATRFARKWSTALGAAALSVALIGSAASPAAASPPLPAAHPAGKISAPARDAVAVPSVSGPVAGSPGPGVSGLFDLGSVGYRQSEFFVSGQAKAYTNTAPLGSDGRWTAAPASAAAYTTRVVVLAPQRARDFSGTVVVEWLNVSAGMDSAPDWFMAHDEMIRSGDVYIGVSAQAVGVNALKATNPARYGALTHPGDSYSYDIFSQVGKAVDKRATTLVPGLHPRTVIADGESQSASRLTTYVNAIAPRTEVFDAYLIHSRNGSSAALSQAPQPAIPAPAVVQTRTDTRAPVLTFQTETDLTTLGYLPARQTDSRHFRLWEAAGTSHADAYVLTVASNDANTQAADDELFGLLRNPPSSLNVGGFSVSCTAPFNAGQQHYIFQTALHQLKRWARTGIAPRPMPRLAVDAAGAYVLDSSGNVRGGIRSPAVDVPLATLSGQPPADAPGFCRLFGQTRPFTQAELAAKYSSYPAFVFRWRLSVIDGLFRGYLLPQDAVRLYRVVS